MFLLRDVWYRTVVPYGCLYIYVFLTSMVHGRQICHFRFVVCGVEVHIRPTIFLQEKEKERERRFRKGRGFLPTDYTYMMTTHILLFRRQPPGAPYTPLHTTHVLHHSTITCPYQMWPMMAHDHTWCHAYVYYIYIKHIYLTYIYTGE